MEKIQQIVKRVYPSGYTGDTLAELNKLLANGWTIKMVVPSSQGTRNGGIINDYVLEKNNKRLTE